MLSYDGENRLRNFLTAVGDGERDLEFARSRLCSISDFVPRAAFQRMDRNACGSVDTSELMAFLRDNGVHHVSDSEAYNLISFFDSDGNKKLAFDEFVQMFLPCEDNYLRDRTTVRVAPAVLAHENLPRDIETAMCDVVEKEIALQRRLESLKTDLGYTVGYSAYAAFNTVERFTRSGVLNTVNIGDFLRSQGHYASEVELVAIVRRIDTDGNCTISSGELAEFMRPLGGVKPTYASPARTASTRYSSPVRVRTTTSLLESEVRASINRSMSVERKSTYVPVSPLYVSPSRYYDLDYPYYRYGYGYDRYGVSYPYSKYSPYYSPYVSRYYPSYYPYRSYADSYWSSALGRYVYY
jgi:Ca2+-binding EF-hand superfamily protein